MLVLTNQISFNALPFEIRATIFRYLDLDALFNIMPALGKENYKIITSPDSQILSFSFEYWFTSPDKAVPNFVKAQIFAEQQAEITHFANRQAPITKTIKDWLKSKVWEHRTYIPVNQDAFFSQLASVEDLPTLTQPYRKKELLARHNWLNKINTQLYLFYTVTKPYFNEKLIFEPSTHLLTRLPSSLLATEFSIPFSEPQTRLMPRLLIKWTQFWGKGYWQNLTEMFLDSQRLMRLPSLQELGALTILRVSNNQLKSLPSLPNNLRELDAANNCLNRLSVDLPAKLKKLDVTRNFLTHLPFDAAQRPILFCFATDKSISWKRTKSTQKVKPDQENTASTPKL